VLQAPGWAHVPNASSPASLALLKQLKQRSQRKIAIMFIGVADKKYKKRSLKLALHTGSYD
jgi:hypothetical protein